MFTEALFRVAKTQKQPKYASTDEKINLRHRGLPGGPGLRTWALSVPQPQAQSLVEELRSHKSQGTTPPKKKEM